MASGASRQDLRHVSPFSSGYGRRLAIEPQLLAQPGAIDHPRSCSTSHSCTEGCCRAVGLWNKRDITGTLGKPVLSLKTERVGFEPTEGFPSNDFESFAFDHSATSPGDPPNPPCESGPDHCGIVRSHHPPARAREPLAPVARQPPGSGEPEAGGAPLIQTEWIPSERSRRRSECRGTKPSQTPDPSAQIA